ncbi:MAG: hypothetical protein HYZ53_14040 [Planctomycetes bacterium]|nr:hypothetical protein [Planctomycetota bacterium]
MEQGTRSRLRPEMTVAEVVRSHPDTVRTFLALGIHIRQFGGWTLAEACGYQSLQLREVLARLDAEVAGDAPAPSPQPPGTGGEEDAHRRDL